jgi:ribose/xylose/arabinose/galactoside ABC-type transport system permease subunit
MFDLSIAGVASLTTMMAIGLVVNQGIPLWLALILCLLMGMTVGLVNAFLVERVRVNAFIATLGTGGIAAGIGDTYAGGTVVSPGVGGHPMPNWFTDFGDFQYKAPGWLILAFVVLIALMIFFNADRVRPESMNDRGWLLLKVGVAAAIIIAAVLAFPVWTWMSDVSWMIVALLVVSLAIWVLMEQTTYGRHLRAIGSNRPAAVLAGVNTRRQVYKTFILAGAIAAFAGICLAAVSGAAEPDAAATYLLPAFAAVFLSTVVLSHGRFTVTGTIVSGAFVVWIGIGLIIGGINANAVDVLNGVVLVGAVGLATVVRRK